MIVMRPYSHSDDYDSSCTRRKFPPPGSLPFHERMSSRGALLWLEVTHHWRESILKHPRSMLLGIPNYRHWAFSGDSESIEGHSSGDSLCRITKDMAATMWKTQFDPCLPGGRLAYERLNAGRQKRVLEQPLVIEGTCCARPTNFPRNPAS
jgi:hypothetical protein